MSSILSALFVLALSGAGSSPLRAQSPGATDSYPPAVAIDGEPIPWNEFAQWLLLLQGKSNVEHFVLDHLLEREALRVGINARDEVLLENIDATIAKRIESAFGGDRSLWVAELERLGQSPELHRAEHLGATRTDFWTNELVRRRRVISEERLRARWESRYGPEGREMHMSLLFLRITPPPHPPGTTRDEHIRRNDIAKQATLDRALELLGTIRLKGNFDALVAEFSEDKRSRENGGQLEGAFVTSRWPSVPLEKLRQLKVGEVLEPFHGNGGFNLMRLDWEKRTPLADVQSMLTKELLGEPANQSEARELLDSLREAATVEVLPEFLRDVGPESPRLDRPLLVIDGVAVTRAEFSQWLIAQRGRPLIRSFAQNRFIRERANSAGIWVTPVEVEQRAQEDLERQIELYFEGDREAWLSQLAGKGQTPDESMHVARIQGAHILRTERLLMRERTISAEMLQREWEDRYGVGGQTLDLRYILRRISEPADRVLTSDEELREYIETQTREILSSLSDLRQRALDGEDFAALARTYSEEPESRDRGGRPLERIKLYECQESVQKTLRALEPGEIAEPIDHGNGTFRLFELVGVVHVPLEDVEEELERDLLTRRPSQIEVASYINLLTKSLVVTPLAGMFR